MPVCSPSVELERISTTVVALPAPIVVQGLTRSQVTSWHWQLESTLKHWQTVLVMPSIKTNSSHIIFSKLASDY